MGEKDITEKMLEDYNDVFADISNVLLWQGKQVILEDELENAKDKSQYKAEDGKIHEQERDVAKFWKKGEIRIAMCGFENQTTVDKDMPLRVMGYDGASYKSQILSTKKDRYPVITMILYFGMKPGVHPHSLYECLEIPEEIKAYVSDYKINVFQIAYLTDEQVNMFTSDFRIIADYFVQMRKKNDYKPSKDEIKHVDELLKLMSVLTNDDRYVKVQEEGKGMVTNMCVAMDKAEARGEARGEAKGEVRGKVMAYDDMGMTVAEIANKVGISEKDVSEILKSNSKS